MTSREDVYMAINTEREYQDALDDTRTDGSDHTVGDYVTMMQHYQNELVRAWTLNPGDDAALEVMRKIAGIAVHCMEDHGAPARTNQTYWYGERIEELEEKYERDS